jgi:hypothetical protein
VYDVSGRIVKSIRLGPIRRASALTWDGSDDHGAPVSAGIYLLRLEAGGVVLGSAKTTVLR